MEEQIYKLKDEESKLIDQLNDKNVEIQNLKDNSKSNSELLKQLKNKNDKIHQ